MLDYYILGYYVGLIFVLFFYTWAFIRSIKKKHKIMSTLILIGFAINVFIETSFPIGELLFLFPIVYLITDFILTKKKIKVKLVD